MRTALVFAALAGTSSALLHPREYYEDRFVDWMHEHGMKFVDGREFVHRLGIFAANDDKIALHNAGNLSWTLGHNKFSHMTEAEFMEYVQACNLQFPENWKVNSTPYVPRPVPTNGEVDWVAKGAVTPVKDQAQCGSCWAFSTTGAMEGAFFLAKGTLQSFSEQELVDCAKNGNYGCSGGWPYLAADWARQNGGLAAEGSYPYHAVDQTCQTVASVAGSAPKGYQNIGTETALESAANTQPVSICIEVNSSFQLYKSGVYNGPCGQSLNHAVLVAGYSSSGNYWKVKNSWGTSWGEQGYIRMTKGKNLCGMANKAMIVTY